jgi:peptidoglycan/xylan/chitin deacetylase (PgdA/CDA1 family)
MGIIRKIKQKAESFYRQRIVCEQYPMLTPISRKKLQAEGAMGVVYMLHHIKEKNPQGIPTNEDLKVSPSFLDKIISKYEKQGFDFISLDELSEIISSDKKPERPFICFTIDDGYLDNYTQALPVFERHQVPFAIFVATDFIDHKAILWWDVIEELILKNDSITIGGKHYPCHTFQEKWDAFRILRERILRFDQTKLEEELRNMFSHYDIDWFAPIRHQAMSWEQIKSISQHPLCTIGGHTVSHLALNKLDDNEFHREIAEGITKIQEVTGKPVSHFAYPYGSPNEIGEREYKLISEYHFKTVFSSYGGCISEDNKHLTTHLPRVYLHER